MVGNPTVGDRLLELGCITATERGGIHRFGIEAATATARSTGTGSSNSTGISGVSEVAWALRSMVNISY